MLKSVTTILLLGMCAIGYAQVAAGDRVIAMQIDVSETQEYDEGVQMAKDLCVTSVHQAFSWKGMEPEPEAIGGELFDLLDVVDFYYPQNNMKVELNIPVINTVIREVPSDLEDLPFDDPLMIERFNILLDSVFAHLTNVELAALNIGNESNIMLAWDEQAIAEFKTFFEATKQHAEELYLSIHGEDLNVGTTLTFEAFESADMFSLYESLNENADVISVTYYGITDGFQVKAPEEVESDFALLVSRYENGNQPIYMCECGYPSSATCGSSEAMQASFFDHVFEAWDDHIDVLKYMTIFKLADWSQSDVDVFGEYYGLPDSEEFKEYLRTLGVRTYPGSGEDKPAMETIRCAADARDFCSTSCATPILDRLSFDEYQIFPNPATEYFQTNIPVEKMSRILVRDTKGRMIKAFTETERCDVSEMERGMYLVQIVGVEGVVIHTSKLNLY